MAQQSDPLTGSWAVTPGVRRRMQLQAERDTVPELRLRKELHRRGLRYWVDRSVVPGAPRRRVDMVFPREQIAVFVDGCFWHGCPEHGRRVHNVNSWYWPDKIKGNIARDRDTDARLTQDGWRVIRVWEHADHIAAADAIEEYVHGSRLPMKPNEK